MCEGGSEGDDGTADQDESLGFGNVTDTSGVTAETSGKGSTNVSNVGPDSNLSYSPQFSADVAQSQGLDPSVSLSPADYSQTTQGQAAAAAQNASMDQSLADTMSLANPVQGVSRGMSPGQSMAMYGTPGFNLAADPMGLDINQTQQQNMATNIGLATMGRNNQLSQDAMDTLGKGGSSKSSGYSGFGRGKDDKDVSNFTTADQMNSMSYSINNPISNTLTALGFPTTQNQINMGYTPSYSQGQITGATGYGIGMGSPTGSVPGYEGFEATSPSVGIFGGASDIGGNESDSPQIIRRNPSASDKEEFPIAPGPISDELASNYLQDPYYLYSGIGNQYQPYGYAQNTLVDLLRTRNMTQPQQRAANLGLFGNPGDFS